MTDKKEQEIREMAKIREMVKVLEDFCHSEKCKRYDCNYCNCETLYNAGYRKQNEVAKEILKKLKHELEKEKFFTIEQSAFDNAIEHAQIIVDEIAKEYGVEL